MNIRVIKSNGDIRQGRYLRHTKWELHLYDGRNRRIKLYDVQEIIKVPSVPPGACAMDLVDFE